MVEEHDLDLLEKVSDCVHKGLDESGAIKFLAGLTHAEYDRLIALFTGDVQSGLPESAKKKLVAILEKLRAATHVAAGLQAV